MQLTDNTYYLLDDDLSISMIFKTDDLETIADEWQEFETLLSEE